MNDELQSLYCTTTDPAAWLPIIIHGTDKPNCHLGLYSERSIPLCNKYIRASQIKVFVLCKLLLLLHTSVSDKSNSCSVFFCSCSPHHWCNSGMGREGC